MTEAELGLLIERASCAMLIGLTERGTAKNLSWHSLLLTCAKAEAWLFLLDSATTADSCLLSHLYRI